MVENYNVNIEYLLLKVNFFKKVCAFFFLCFFFHSPNNKQLMIDALEIMMMLLNITIFFASTNICWEGFFYLLENEKLRMINVAKTSYLYFLGK